MMVCEINGFAIACSLTEYCAKCCSSKKIDGNDFVLKLNSNYASNGTTWAKPWDSNSMSFIHEFQLRISAYSQTIGICYLS